MITSSEQQYIDLYEQARQMIMNHAPEAMNAVRDEAFEDFKLSGFPSKKVERYKYTDIQKLFEPDSEYQPLLRGKRFVLQRR